MKVVNREADIRLIEHLSDIKEEAKDWVVVCFAFSQLLDHYRSEYQLKIAINLIQDIMNQQEATLYVCTDSTLFLLVNRAGSALLDKLVFQLRYLFMDDPLAYNADGEENPDFSEILKLEDNWQTVMDRCKARLSSNIRARQKQNPRQDSSMKSIPAVAEKKQTAKASASRKDASVTAIKFFNAASLANIERDLANADLSRVLRRQPICAAVPDTMVRRVFDELYINIAHLRKTLGLEVDLLSNRWLFKYLTQILDDRVLHLLQHNPMRYLDNPISLNLNIPTLLSNEFSKFDASIKPSVKFSIVIEIQLADVFNDMSAFLAAKDAVQKMGYRVCLDGVTELSFTQIDRKRLGFDLIKLQWNADIQSDLNSESNQELNLAIRECGVNRVILTRCDNRAAIDYGQALGISLFQGRYLDGLINPKSTIEN